MSAATGDTQFQHRSTHLSNLDRCNRCGLQRAAHGIDWSCPAGPPDSARTGLLVAGVLLAVAGAVLWGLSGSAPSGLNTLAAVAFPGGLILLIATLVRPGRSQPPADREDVPIRGQAWAEFLRDHGLQ
jgi:drug/metabolite transporter (DMT)-like permease